VKAKGEKGVQENSKSIGKGNIRKSGYLVREACAQAIFGNFLGEDRGALKVEGRW